MVFGDYCRLLSFTVRPMLVVAKLQLTTLAQRQNTVLIDFLSKNPVYCVCSSIRPVNGWSV